MISAAESLDRAALTARQGERLGRMLADVYGRNAFYTRKFEAAGIRLDRLRFPDDLGQLPLTTKDELIADQAATPPWGTALTEPIEHYTRYCHTSSTSGQRPLVWVDTNESWQWMIECWKAVYLAAGVHAGDRAFFPFSFGPFLGFWSAFEAGCQLGLHCVPGGGMTSQQRLDIINTVGATVLCCTPTYALRLVEVAAALQPPRLLSQSTIRLLIVAGEPGGSIPATRERIETAWGARVIDHHGATEVGPMSFECLEAPGYLHLNEAEYIFEVLSEKSDQPVGDGDRGELVVTNLGRTASPVIRYRTGDIVVRRSDRCRCGRTWARLEGGVLGRADDMVNVRGVNVYPASVEAVVRRFADVTEFRSIVSWTGALRTLALDIETAPTAVEPEILAHRLVEALRLTLGLSVPVRVVAPGTLPRFEMKARRFIVENE